MDYKITVDDTYEPVLNWILAEQQKYDSDSAPKDNATLLQGAVENMILTPWKVQFEQSAIINIQDTLNNANADVKASATAALAALQKATPEQQKEALDKLSDSLKT